MSYDQYQPGGGAPPAQGFAAHPRVLPQKPKFKDPYGISAPDEYYPQNIMYDKRVFRGSTNAAMVLPAGNYPDTLFDNRKERAKAKAQARAAAAEEFFTRDVRTPEPLQGRQNIDIQTDQFVEELTDKAPCYEIGCQTEIKIERPQTPRFMPKKTGVDKSTLVEDNELFLFEDEVEPILSVLCGKTLEQARMEVLEEEELNTMREQQDYYKRMLTAEVNDITRMEATEEKRLLEFQKNKQNMREKKKNKQQAHRKVVARTMAKSYMGGLRENVFRNLAGVGFYTNTFKIDVLDNDVVPWLHERAFAFVQDLEVQESLATVLAKDHLLGQQEEHAATVAAEAARKQRVKEAEAEALALKMQEKAERRARKEAKKRKEAEAALRAEIDENFIKKGVPASPIIEQEVSNIDGNGEPRPIVGALGGVLGQLIITLSILEKNYNRQLTTGSRKSKASKKSGASSRKRSEDAKKKTEEDEKSMAKTEGGASAAVSVEPKITENGWFTKQNIQNFIHEFVNGDAMKVEKMPLVVGMAYQQFLGNLEKKMALNEMRNMKEPNYSKLRTILRDTTQYGDRVLRLLAEHSEQIGVSANTYQMVYEGFWDLYCKKPATSDLTAKKLDGWINKIHLKVPSYRQPQPEPVPPEEGKDIPPAEVNPEGEEPVGEPEEKQMPPDADLPDPPPLRAIVRVRIPLQREEPPAEGEEGEEQEEPEPKPKSERSGRSRASKKVEEEKVTPEIEFVDAVTLVQTQAEDGAYQVYVVHQLAQRVLRQTIVGAFRSHLSKELDAINEEDMMTQVESEAEEIEKNFLATFFRDIPHYDFELS